MQAIAPTRLSVSTRNLFEENNSVNKKYTEITSRTENNMKIKNFFINKRRNGCIQAAVSLTF